MRRLPVLASATIVGAACVLTSLGTAHAAAGGRTTLPGSVPGWAKAANLKGAADPSGNVGFRVYLGWKDESAVQSLAKAVSTPGSSSYRQYLTPAQFRQRFAPGQADVGAVQSWLKSQGFTVDYTPQNNHYVAAEGTVAQAAADGSDNGDATNGSDNGDAPPPAAFVSAQPCSTPGSPSTSTIAVHQHLMVNIVHDGS